MLMASLEGRRPLRLGRHPSRRAMRAPQDDGEQTSSLLLATRSAPESCRRRHQEPSPLAIVVRLFRRWRPVGYDRCGARTRIHRRHCEEWSDEAIQGGLHEALDCFAGARNDGRNKKEAERRKAQTSNHRTLRCGAAPAGAARLLAFHRGSRQRDIGPQGSASGHASWDLAGAFDPVRAPQPGGGDQATLHGHYPRRACPSPAKHLAHRLLCRQVDARAARAPARRRRTSPRQTGVTGRRPSRGRDSMANSN